MLDLLYRRDWHTLMVHVYREANNCANWMSNLGRIESFSWTLLYAASPVLAFYIIEDDVV